jgi:hypothetical protein
MTSITSVESAAGRPAAEGAAQRRDPELRDAGDADRAHHLRRRLAGHGLQLHHRHRRLVGGGAAARPPGAAADRPRPGHIEAIWRDLLFSTHATSGRRDHQPRAGRDRHRAVGLRCRATACRCGGRRRREAADPGLHHRRRLAAPPTDTIVRETVAAPRRRASRAPRSRSAKPHVAEDVGAAAAVREAVGDDFEIMVDANQCFTLAEAIRRAAPRRAGHRLVRGAAAGRRPRGPRAPGAASSVPIAVGESLYSPAQFRGLPAAAPARSCRWTWRASAASRPG